MTDSINPMTKNKLDNCNSSTLSMDNVKVCFSDNNCKTLGRAIPPQKRNSQKRSSRLLSHWATVSKRPFNFPDNDRSFDTTVVTRFDCVASVCYVTKSNNCRRRGLSPKRWKCSSPAHDRGGWIFKFWGRMKKRARVARDGWIDKFPAIYSDLHGWISSYSRAETPFKNGPGSRSW